MEVLRAIGYGRVCTRRDKWVDRKRNEGPARLRMKGGSMAGPLHGIRIVELASIGSGPFAATMLADHGAQVVRIERRGISAEARTAMRRDILLRSRTMVELDLKDAGDAEHARAMINQANGVIEGFRPGVAERLGLGPDSLMERNPSLVYGRVTGWGQTGPYAQVPGHDINYLALSGALHAFGRAGDKPTPPVNVVTSFGGGMALAFAMVSALLHARETNAGQIIDCATGETGAMLTAVIRTMMAQGTWRDERGVNMLDTGAPFYETYVTADSKYIAIGAVEPQFHVRLCELAGIDSELIADRMNFDLWPSRKARMAEIFTSRTRDEWCALLEGTDTCFAPVLSMREAQAHPHNVARAAFVEAGEVVQPSPGPRYSGLDTVAPRMWDGQFADPENAWRRAPVEI